MTYLSRLRDAFAAAPTEDAKAALADLIAAAPVASLEDVRAKIAALAWCREGIEDSTTEGRILMSLIGSLAPAAPQGA